MTEDRLHLFDWEAFPDEDETEDADLPPVLVEGQPASVH
jgi:hypothetical protein